MSIETAIAKFSQDLLALGYKEAEITLKLNESHFYNTIFVQNRWFNYGDKKLRSSDKLTFYTALKNPVTLEISNKEKKDELRSQINNMTESLESLKEELEELK